MNDSTSSFDEKAGSISASGKTGHGVQSVLPYLHKQFQVKVPLPIDELLQADAELSGAAVAAQKNPPAAGRATSKKS